MYLAFFEGFGVEGFAPDIVVDVGDLDGLLPRLEDAPSLIVVSLQELWLC